MENNETFFPDVRKALEELGFVCIPMHEHFENHPELDFEYLWCHIKKDSKDKKDGDKAWSVYDTSFNIKKDPFTHNLIFYKDLLYSYGVKNRRHLQKCVSPMELRILGKECLKQITNEFYNWEYGFDNSSKFRSKINFWDL